MPQLYQQERAFLDRRAETGDRKENPPADYWQIVVMPSDRGFAVSSLSGLRFPLSGFTS
jgi:hypothetical protein